MFLREIILQLKSYIDPHTVIVGDFNTPPSPIEKSSGEKHEQRNAVAYKHYRPSRPYRYYRIFYTNTHTFLFTHHGIFLKTIHILGKKSNFNKFKRI